MIYTLTANPAIDYNIACDGLAANTVTRTRNAVYTPNGKGLNVSFTLDHYGVDTTILGFFAGFSGEFIVKGAEALGVPVKPVWTDGITRVNVFLNAGPDTEYNMVNAGAAINEANEQEMFELIDSLDDMTCLVISGSLPPNTSEGFLAEVLRRIKAKGAEFVLDISSHQLADLIAMEPLLIKPNDDELLDIFGIKVSGGERIEVTTYRLDGFYTDGRHPQSVERAASLEDDLARRDFTVNAMAWHPERGLVDRYDGQGDLERKLIRAVGDPKRRFNEDALRMLRAVRFACRLDFMIEPETKRALAECAPLLDAVARERVGIELEGILSTGHGGDAMLRYPELICAAVPELAAGRGFDQRSVYHAFNVYEHIARVLTVAGELALCDGVAPSSSLMWAAFLHDVSKPDCFTVDHAGSGHFYGHPELGAKKARVIMDRLALSHDLVRDVCLLIKYHDKPLRPERSCLLNMMRALSGEGVDTARLIDELMDLKRADTLGKAPSCFYYVETIEEMRAMAHELLKAGEPYMLKMLAINGGDLIRAGVKPGPELGQLLNSALDAVIEDNIPNEREALLTHPHLG